MRARGHKAVPYAVGSILSFTLLGVLFGSFAQASTPSSAASADTKRHTIERLARAYWRVLTRVAHVHEVGTREYWEKLREASREAVSRTSGIAADIVNDAAAEIIRKQARRDGFVESSEAFQCTSALPAVGYKLVGPVGAATQMKHTWLQIGDGRDARTYGMAAPFTSVVKGEGAIRSPDVYVAHGGLQAVTCHPIYRDHRESERQFTKDLNCISELASAQYPESFETRQLLLEYDFFANNCTSAVRLMVECAGGRISQVPNATIGDTYEWKDPVRFVTRSERLSKLVERADEDISGALKLLKRVLQKGVPEKELRAALRELNEKHLPRVRKAVDAIGETGHLSFPVAEPGKWLEDVLDDLGDLAGTLASPLLSSASRARMALKNAYQSLGQLRNKVLWQYTQSRPATLQSACRQLRRECGMPAD